mgnify:FL=1
MRTGGRGWWWGLLLLLVVVGITAAYSLLRTGRLEPMAGAGTVLTGLVSDEVLPFVTDPEVRAILRERYDLELCVSPAGPTEMVRRGAAEADFLWCTGVWLVDTYRLTGGSLVRAEPVLQSPLVLYTWDQVAEALVREGLAERHEAGYHSVEWAPLAEAILAGGAWADWGVQEPVGPVEVVPPDPAQSGLGALYVAHLIGASEGTLADALPAVRSLLSDLGYLYPSSETLFGLYAEQGPGALPLIVGQERQMLALLAAHPGEEAAIRGRLRVLYPRPTVWVRHPLLVLDERAVPLLAALGDDDVRRLAWARYGYRAGAGAAEDPAALEAAGLPVTIEATAPPDAETMNRIILGLEQ